MNEYLENAKENVFHNFTVMIKKSWTYERLTEEEREKIISILNDTRTKNEVKGTYYQRWNILGLVYSSFINALGYMPSGWRE